MERIDFYKKKAELHDEMIRAICEIMDNQMVEEIDFEHLGMNGGYAVIAPSFSPAFEAPVYKLSHKMGTNELDAILFDEYGNRWDASLNDYDVLNASIGTVYEAVYDLFYNDNFKEERRIFNDTQRRNQGAVD